MMRVALAAIQHRDVQLLVTPSETRFALSQVPPATSRFSRDRHSRRARHVDDPRQYRMECAVAIRRIRQNTAAFVSIRQHTSAYVRKRGRC